MSQKDVERSLYSYIDAMNKSLSDMNDTLVDQSAKQSKQIEELQKESAFNFEQYQDVARLLNEEAEKNETLHAIIALKNEAISLLTKNGRIPPTANDFNKAKAYLNIQPGQFSLNKLKADALFMAATNMPHFSGEDSHKQICWLIDEGVRISRLGDE